MSEKNKALVRRLIKEVEKGNLNVIDNLLRYSRLMILQGNLFPYPNTL